MRFVYQASVERKAFMMLFIFFTLSWDEVTQECDKWFQVFLDGIRGWFTGQNEEPPWEVSMREWGGVTPVKIEVWISNPKDYYLTCEPPRGVRH